MALFDDLLGKAKKNPLMAAGLASLPVAPVFGVGVLAVDDILKKKQREKDAYNRACLLYTSPSPRDMRRSRMPSSA